MNRLHTLPPTEQIYRSHVPPKYDSFPIEKYFATRFSYQDEEEWTALGSVNFEYRALFEEEPVRLSLPYETNSSIPISKIRIHFENAGELMFWHPGAGYPSYFFVDEVTLE